MKVQLLLLVALTGSFCGFTSASPTFATELLSASPEKNPETTVVDSPKLDAVTKVITGPPPTLPEALPEIVSKTQSAPSAAPTTQYDFKPFVFTESHSIFTETETATHVAQTEAPAVETSAPDTVTDSPTPDDRSPAAGDEDQTEGQKMEDGLDVELTDEEESLSSGQIIGIVIGALLAVVIVVAVVIAVVRRMGKYSSAKSRKTAKKDSAVVSPLRKKLTKQKQSAKFWKN